MKDFVFCCFFLSLTIASGVVAGEENIFEQLLRVSSTLEAQQLREKFFSSQPEQVRDFLRSHQASELNRLKRSLLIQLFVAADSEEFSSERAMELCQSFSELERLRWQQMLTQADFIRFQKQTNRTIADLSAKVESTQAQLKEIVAKLAALTQNEWSNSSTSLYSDQSKANVDHSWQDVLGNDVIFSTQSISNLDRQASGLIPVDVDADANDDPTQGVIWSFAQLSDDTSILGRNVDEEAEQSASPTFELKESVSDRLSFEMKNVNSLKGRLFFPEWFRREFDKPTALDFLKSKTFLFKHPGAWLVVVGIPFVYAFIELDEALPQGIDYELYDFPGENLLHFSSSKDDERAKNLREVLSQRVLPETCRLLIKRIGLSF